MAPKKTTEIVAIEDTTKLLKIDLTNRLVEPVAPSENNIR
jgi:hypothetical protein